MTSLTREQAESLYDSGKDSVVELLLQLVSRVQALEEQVAKNSGNSSKPPSSDGLSKSVLRPMSPMPQSLRKKTGKKPGAQMGHVGKTLEPVSTPDRAVVHHPSACQHCNAPLSGEPRSVAYPYSRRQVFEMPEPKVFVTEHRVVTLACSCCGHETSAAFPKGVDQPVQYGPNLLGFAAYLHSAHLVPYARCAQIVQDVTGAPFSVGTLNRALRVAYERLASFEQGVKEALADASLTPVKHVDETGGRIAGKLHWFHVRCTDSLCWLFRHEKRGGKAVEDLHSYTGTLVSDFWSSYVSLLCEHLFCGAHLLRELTFVFEVLKQPWAASLKAELESAVDGCHAARARGYARVNPRANPKLWDARAVARRFDQWVQEGLKANPLIKGISKSKARRLAERLSAYKDDYLRFLFDLTLPFTNNEAERDLRMFKVKGKISGCFRTTQGADIYCRIRSYTQTCHKQGLKLLDCLRSVFAAEPIMPSLKHA